MDEIRVQDKEVEEVDEFVCLGAKVSKGGGRTEDVKNRLRKAKGAFQSLPKVWNTRSIGKKTKINLFKTLVRSVLLCGYVTWKMTKFEEKKLDAFSLNVDQVACSSKQQPNYGYMYNICQQN